jgi:hypothetical protein
MESEKAQRLLCQAFAEVTAFAPGRNEGHLLWGIYNIWRFAFFNGERAIPLGRRRRIARLANDILLEAEGGPPGFWNELGDVSGREPDWRNVPRERRATELLEDLNGLGGLKPGFLDALRTRAASERQRFATSHARGGDRRSGEHSLKTSVLRAAVLLYCEAHVEPDYSKSGPLVRFANTLGELALDTRAPFTPDAVRAVFRRMMPRARRIKPGAGRVLYRNEAAP